MRRIDPRVVIAAVSLLAPSALADAAADKATARTAAMEGIEHFRAGRHAEALDRLRRAQALYDAPVHLLYIARAQAALGQVVEAAENYRLLDRHPLGEAPPAAWVAAVADGRRELVALEPRIPTLQVTLSPAEVAGVEVTLDGEPVPAAALGLARPVNPGRRVLRATAPGRSPVEQSVDVAPGAREQLELELADASATAAPAAGATRADAARPIGFHLGLRLAGAVATGSLAKDVRVSDAFQPGGAMELQVGVRIARHFTPVLFFEGAGYAPGGGILGATAVKDARGATLGLGLLVGTAPGKMGGFGELDLALVHSLTTGGEFSGETCELATSGAALRLGGGGAFPVKDWLALTPYAMATLGSFNRVDSTRACLAAASGAPGAWFGAKGEIDEDDRAGHASIVLGLGGTLMVGPDRP